MTIHDVSQAQRIRLTLLLGTVSRYGMGYPVASVSPQDFINFKKVS